MEKPLDPRPVSAVNENEQIPGETTKKMEAAARNEAISLIALFGKDRAVSHVDFVLSPEFGLEKIENIRFWGLVSKCLAGESTGENQAQAGQSNSDK